MQVKSKEQPASMPEFGTLKRMPISALKGASHNPKSRTDFKSAALRRLRASIEKIGLIYPIAIDKANTVIDGHRRLMACKMLGWAEVPVLVVPNEDHAEVYAEVNANSEVMSGLQILQVYLQEPTAVAERSRRALERYEEAFGRAAMRRLIKAKLSYHTLGVVQRIARYVDDESDAFLGKTLDYLIEKRNGRIVRSYMTLKQPPSDLWETINKNKNLELSFS